MYREVVGGKDELLYARLPKQVLVLAVHPTAESQEVCRAFTCMSTQQEPAACNTCANETERLELLESQVRDLADKMRTQESGSMEIGCRLEELTCEADKHKTQVVGMLENFVEPNTHDEKEKGSSELTGECSEREVEDITTNSS